MRQVDPSAVEGRAFLGELGLDGALRSVPGALCLTEALGPRAIVLPEANAHEAADDQGVIHHLLYGSIGPQDISKALKGKNLSVEPDMVRLDHPIREANTLTPVPLNLGYGIEASIQVLVVALQQGKK